MKTKTFITLALVFFLGALIGAFGRQAVSSDKSAISRTPLIDADLVECPDKEARMYTVQIAPGAMTPRHQHPGHYLTYVLEGTGVVQRDGKADGTPVPIMATQQLITQKPYSYCRNPMALGAILMYLGVALFIGSISGAGLVLLFSILLLTYIKLLEEKEMELRFGDAYREYRNQTPFIIPRLWKRK